MIENTDELLGWFNTYNRLVRIWEIFSDLENYRMNIYKEDYGMNRSLEMLVHRARIKVSEAKLLVDETLRDLWSKIERCLGK